MARDIMIHGGSLAAASDRLSTTSEGGRGPAPGPPSASECVVPKSGAPAVRILDVAGIGTLFEHGREPAMTPRE